MPARGDDLGAALDGAIDEHIFAQFAVTCSIRRGFTLRTVTVLWLDYRTDERDGSLIQLADRRLVIRGDVPDPEQDRLVDGDTLWRFVAPPMIRPPSGPGATVIYADCQVRR
jgi:hypothetical protein